MVAASRPHNSYELLHMACKQEAMHCKIEESCGTCWLSLRMTIMFLSRKPAWFMAS